MSRVISNETRANRAIELAESLADKGEIRREQIPNYVRSLISKDPKEWLEIEYKKAEI